jgi:hypothetical protein
MGRWNNRKRLKIKIIRQPDEAMGHRPLILIGQETNRDWEYAIQPTINNHKSTIMRLVIERLKRDEMTGDDG